MDHREEPKGQNSYQLDLKKGTIDEKELMKSWVEIDGQAYRVPYKIIKKVIFSDVKKEDMIDAEHAARLQYRLMLQDPIIKATVNFLHSRITVIYNPKTADNLREKINQEEIIDFLAKEGVYVDKAKIKEEDYDYYKELYSYAFNPKSIREHAPYGWTLKKWREMKPEWEQKQKDGEKAKMAKFHAWQDQYIQTQKEINDPIAAAASVKEQPKTLKEKIFGKKKPKEKNEKGFWFHGA
jgi:hypothetical protein